MWSLATLFTPTAAHHSPAALLAVRMLMGLGQGVAFPAIHAAIASGVPAARRSGAIGAVMAAAFAGSALAFGASPAIIAAAGWPAVFYTFSAASGVWLLAAARAAATARRRAGAAGAAAPDGGEAATSRATQAPGPPAPGTGLPALLRRKEVWAIALTQYCSAFGFFSLLAWLPTFFAECFSVELGQLGAYTVLPYVLQVRCSSWARAPHVLQLGCAGPPVPRGRGPYHSSCRQAQPTRRTIAVWSPRADAGCRLAPVGL